MSSGCLFPIPLTWRGLASPSSKAAAKVTCFHLFFHLHLWQRPSLVEFNPNPNLVWIAAHCHYAQQALCFGVHLQVHAWRSGQVQTCLSAPRPLLQLCTSQWQSPWILCQIAPRLRFVSSGMAPTMYQGEINPARVKLHVLNKASILVSLFLLPRHNHWGNE